MRTFILLLLCLSPILARAENLVIPVEPIPAWVVNQGLDLTKEVPHEDVQKGVYYVISDVQVRVPEKGQTEYYSHLAMHITNANGLEQNSQLSIHFRSAFENLVMHELSIWRDGKKIEKLSSARKTILQREEEMEQLIYTGKHTYNIILDDVRVGDTIDYRYSIRGTNPVLQGIFSDAQPIEWAVPVGRMYLRYVWERSRTPHYRMSKGNDQFMVRPLKKGSEYVLEKFNLEAVTIEDNTPVWFSPWTTVYFSELESWSEVVDWGIPLYDVAGKPEPIKQQAEAVRLQYPDDVEAQISGLLNYVQNEVRYLGVEIGENSYKPTPASTTLERRYGDCKDKSVLLISLLQHIGVKAYPALVNTELRKELINIPPGISAFDHVIVYLEFDGKVWWLDPTRIHQYGKISSIHQPNYGYALVLKPGNTDLLAMEPVHEANQVWVDYAFDLKEGGEGAALFSARTNYHGRTAEEQRSHVADRGKTELQNNFLKYYKEYYPGLERSEPVLFEDDHDANKLSYHEKYIIHDFWKEDKANNKVKGWFYADLVQNYLKKPDQSERTQPLYIKYPANYRQVISVQMDDRDWFFNDETFNEDNAFFSFSSAVSWDAASKILTLTYDYSSKVSFISPEQYPDYLAALEKTSDYLDYGIYRSTTASVSEAQDVDDTNWALAIIGVIIAGYVLVILLWRIDAWRRPLQGEAVFFPVSLPKLCYMWFMTLGLYAWYWFYHNWSYIKKRDKSSLMPTWRAIFYMFWYYPFYAQLRKDASQRAENAGLPGKAVAILLAVLMFCLMGFSNMDGLVIASLALSMAAVYPLANYINLVNPEETEISRRSSRFSFRHYLLGIISVPVLVYLLGMDIGIIPSNRVVPGSKLLEFHTRFLERHGMLEPGEELQYFYCNEVLFLQDDGSGFTPRHVFSYWKEGGQLRIESAPYAEIADIQITWATTIKDNTTIKIVRDDESWFILYASKEKRLDRVFVDALKKNWEKARKNP